MSMLSISRQASIDEIAAEMDRRGAIIEQLEAEIEVLRNAAHVAGNLKLLYSIRSALGWNDKTSLSIMPEGVRRLHNANAAMMTSLEALVNAEALSGVRSLVAGWNGENRQEGPHYSRHPSQLGATLPKTNCGAVYDLDEAMQAARAVISKAKGGAA